MQEPGEIGERPGRIDPALQQGVLGVGAPFPLRFDGGDLDAAGTPPLIKRAQHGLFRSGGVGGKTAGLDCLPERFRAVLPVPARRGRPRWNAAGWRFPRIAFSSDRRAGSRTSRSRMSSPTATPAAIMNHRCRLGMLMSSDCGCSVIHDISLNHFRQKMDAMPGIPTTLWFTPNRTTAQMREETNNPKFVYEISCDQMCGAGRFNMRGIITVDTEDEYKKWIAEKNKTPEYFSVYPDKAPPKADTGTVKQTAQVVAPGGK